MLAPDTKVETPSLSGKGGKEDIFSALNEDADDSLDLTTPLKDKKEDKKDKKEDKAEDKEEGEEDKEDKEDKDGEEDEDAEEVDELTELEEELEGPDDEKLELTTPVRRREILKKYPTLFKDFPYLEKAYYREQQFTEYFAHPNDAKAAIEDSQTLAKFEDDIIQKGNTKNVLKLIRDNNPEAFATVVDNYLDNLASIDKEAYQHVIGNNIKNVIIGMVQEAKDSNNDDLRIAAKMLNEYVFGSARFTPPQKMSKEVSSDDKEKETSISNREREFVKRQIDTAHGDINTRVTNVIKSAVLQNIDPKNEMTEFLKNSATDKALAKVTELIDKDVRLNKIIEKLWEKASKNNFSKSSLDEIKKTYLSRAKSLLTPVLESVRREALKGHGRKKKVDDNDDNDENNNDQGEKPQRVKSEPRLSSDKTKASLDKYKGMSSHEALNAMMGDK